MQDVLRAGVVITTGYVHVLGDAASILTDPCLGLSTDFPWAFVFATFATLFTFCLEYFLQRYFRARLGLPQSVGERRADTVPFSFRASSIRADCASVASVHLHSVNASCVPVPEAM